MEITRKKIAVIFGTRFDTFTLAPVFQELQKHERFFTLTVITTEQNRETLGDILSVFDIIPNYDLNVTGLRQSLSTLTQNILERLDYIFAVEPPDMVLVQGDSAAAFASSIAAFHRKIPIIHITAGFRDGGKKEPFPDQAYRRLTSRIADIHCTSSGAATKRLVKEGTPKKDIFCAGNTIPDALQKILRPHFDFSAAVPESLFQKKKKIVIVTKRSDEAPNEDLLKVCAALKKLSGMHPQINFVFPVFKNLTVREAAADVLKEMQNVFLTKPLAFSDFVNLAALSHIVFTDSDGVLETAEALGKPVLMLRDGPDRPEAGKTVTVKFAGTEIEGIVKTGNALLRSKTLHPKMSGILNSSGDGKASERIVALLLHYFGFSKKRPSVFRPKSR